MEFWCALANITEDNKVDGKVLFQQVLFFLDVYDIKKCKDSDEVVIPQLDNEKDSLDALEKATGKKFKYQKTPMGHYAFMPIKEEK